jgi:hypothetical protein
VLSFILPKLFYFAITYQLRGRQDFDSELEADTKKIKTLGVRSWLL